MGQLTDTIMSYAAEGPFTSRNIIERYDLNPANTTRRLKKLCEQGKLQRRKAIGSKCFVYSLPTEGF